MSNLGVPCVVGLELSVAPAIYINPDPTGPMGPAGPQGPPGEADKRMGGCLLGDPLAATFHPGISKAVLRIPDELAGMSLFLVGACCSSAASAGTTTIQYRRVRAGSADASMLSTLISIEPGETDSLTAAVQPVINPANRLVAAGDQIHFDVLTVGTGAVGVFVSFTFKTL